MLLGWLGLLNFNLTGLCLEPAVCPGGGTTSVSGTVYAPNGIDPVCNALIYVPNGAEGAPTYGVAAITPGVQCGQFGSDVTGSPLVSTFSAVNGTFTLNNMPSGADIPLVIQIGRWRRKITIPNVAPCANTALTVLQTRLPAKEAEFDPADNIPLIAISTGEVDAMECVLLKIGINSDQFSNPGGTGRVQFYTGEGGPGAEISASTPSATQLYGTQAAIDQYDMVFFPCQGSPTAKGSAKQQILINYANAGGRVFVTHRNYVWLYNDSPFSATADWEIADDDLAFANDPETGYINQTFPGGQTLAQWLQAVGASTTLEQISVGALYDNFTNVVAPSELWISVHDSTLGTVPMLYSFDTPVGQPVDEQCGRVIFCDFHVENTANNPTTGIVFPSECTLGATTAQEKLLEFMLFDLDSSINPNLPLAATLPVTGTSASTGALYGTANPNSEATTAYFQYGLTTSYGSFSATNSLTATNTTLLVTNVISNLAPVTTYHYQLVAGNGAGTALGGDMTFTTSAQPVIFDLTAARHVSGGAFEFSFTNLSGLGFTVLGTTNLTLPLANWTALGAAVESPAGSGKYQFTDTQNTNQATKYYRVSSP